MKVYIPSTYGVDQRDEKLKIVTFGKLARTLSIFGVDEVVIYRDDDPKADEERNAELLEKYLGYAECPPYLRKALIPRDPDLQYASILPPLQILSHGYSDEFREAVVAEAGEVSVLDAGLDEPVEVAEHLPEGERVTLHMEPEPRVIDPSGIEGFWTWTVESTREDLGGALAAETRPVIGTSRQGEPLDAFADTRFVDEDVAVVFGSPWRGIYDLAERGDVSEDMFAGIYDFVPGQQTKTVRTDEAVPIVLSVMNALRNV